jgi:hypothetical protein
VISMRTSTDCGPVAIANTLEAALGIPAGVTYDRVLAEGGFPNRGDWRDDAWDNPARHVQVVEALTGKTAGIPLILDRAAAVLVHLGGFRFHWVTLLNSVSGCAVWHDGRAICSTSSAANAPVGQIVFCYTLGGPHRPAWWWRAWKSLADCVLSVSKNF